MTLQSAPAFVPSTPTALPFAGKELCVELFRRVRLQRQVWITRHPQLPYFTLGLASHLDAPGPQGLENHREGSASYNPPMDQAFGDFYIALCERLSAYMKAPVVMHLEHARPSFHIYEGHPAFEQPLTIALGEHQASLLPLGEGAKTASTFSFSMAIELPEAGGGLDVWGVDVGVLQALPEGEAAAKLAEATRHEFRYQLGDLVIQSGRWVQRMAAVAPFRGHESRVTLQGHGVFVDGGWQLFG